MPIELRPYQEDAVQGVRSALRSHRAVLLHAPTGAGKTQMAASMMLGAVEKGGRPWMVVHRDFLVEQTHNTLNNVGVPHGFIAAGRPFNPYAPAQVCSIDTLRNRLERVPTSCRPTVMFVDEGHHACSATWAKVIRWALDNGSRVVGLSATPERLDRKGLDELFGHMVRGPSVEWLISQGYLSKYHAFAPNMPDMEGVSSRGGDYATSELEEVMDTDVLTGSIVGHYQRLAAGKRAVYFCVSIKHSQHVAAAFNAAGVVATHLDANSLSCERRSAARSMAIGELDVICNVGLFGEGYDLAAQAGMDVTIEAVGLCRPTQSLAMYMQQVGRALRPKDHPAVILDHAGNIARHGLPDDDREWSLQPKAKKKKSAGPAEEPIRVCPHCFATAAANARVCPFCEEPYPRKEERVMSENEDELVEVDKEALRIARARQEHSCKSLDELIEVGRARGYSRPEAWGAHIWTAREKKRRQREEEADRQRRLW